MIIYYKMNEKPKESIKISKEKQSLENKGWKGFSYRWANTYLVLSSINFIITILSPIFWLEESLFYIFVIICSIGIFGLIIYFYIKKNIYLKLFTLFFNIGGIFAILLVLDKWPIFLFYFLSIFELNAIFLTFYKRKKNTTTEFKTTEFY